MREKALLMISILLSLIFGTFANIPMVYASTSVTVAAGSSNGYVYTYDEAGILLWSYYTGAGVASVAVSSDGAFIAVGSLGNKLYLFTRGGTKLWEKAVPIAFGGAGNGEESKSVAISAHGEYIVAGCTDNLYVYRKDGALYWSHAGKETCIGISPWGNYIVSCNKDDGTIDFFSISSSTPLWTKSIGAFWVATSNLGYVVASSFSKVYMFDSIGAQLWSYTLDRGVFVRVDMPSDGLTAVAVNDDPGDVACYLWYFDLNGLVWKYTPCPPEHDFYSVAISEDGNIISMGPGNIGGIYIYSHDGAPLQIMPLSSWVQSVDLTSDGQFGAFGDHTQGTIWFFSKDSNTPLWSKTLGGSVHAVSLAYYALGVTIDAYCYAETLAVGVGITMDGSPTGYNTPHIFEGLTGTHTFTVPSTDANGHPFFRWSTGETSTSITVTSSGTYIAYYQAKYTLTITTTSGGTTNPSPGAYSYWEGTVASVTALPNTGYGLDYWELDGSYVDAINPISVTMNSNHALQAVFTSDVKIKAHCSIEGVDVSVTIAMDGSPTGYNTPHTFVGLTGTHTFTVPSTDANGHPFCRWSTGETSTSITVTSAGTCTAYYYEGLTINAPNLPSGHQGHTPLLDTGFWLNHGTFASPIWTYYPWGSTLFPPTGTPNEFDIRVPATIRDSQGNNPNNGHAHSFQITEWPGVTVTLGPVAEPAHGSLSTPTYRWVLVSGLPYTTTPVAKRAGPQTDIFRATVITNPDRVLIAMQTGTAHTVRDLIRVADIEELMTDGHTVTYDYGFGIGYIGFNIRPLSIQQVRRPGLAIWPLADVHFRHALLHCYNQQVIVPSIYGYTAWPAWSLVPPTQGGWANPSVPKHEYNPGDPFTSSPSEHSSCGILKAAGYMFIDADGSGTVTSDDYWAKDWRKLPLMTLWTPKLEAAPAWADPGARFVADLGAIGLAATIPNGDSGIELEPTEFNDYMDKVERGLFDCYMSFSRLGRFPDHLYDMCHSSQDAWIYPYRLNYPGINDPVLDNYLETLMTSLDHNTKLIAAYNAQERLYDPDASDQALAYMQLYWRIFFNGFNSDLRGIVTSFGYGSDNYWTYLNIHWAPSTERRTPDGRTYINWILGESPASLNPLHAQNKYISSIMGLVTDGLTIVNPYTHEDLPWIAESCEPVVTPSGPGAMEIFFHIRKNVFWQDGNPYTANDAKFNWLFLKNNQIPKFTSTWQYIDDVVVIDDYTVKVVLSKTSQFLLYGLADTAAILPPPVWGWLDGRPLSQILSYDPSTNTTKPADAGPWFGTPQGSKTQLYGIGPFVFDFWDPVGRVYELHQFSGYFRITEDISSQKVEMFHKCGDVNRDGIVWSDDKAMIGVRFGFMKDIDPGYDPNVDVNSDGMIDMGDMVLAHWFFGEQREYP